MENAVLNTAMYAVETFQLFCFFRMTNKDKEAGTASRLLALLIVIGNLIVNQFMSFELLPGLAYWLLCDLALVHSLYEGRIGRKLLLLLLFFCVLLATDWIAVILMGLAYENGEYAFPTGEAVACIMSRFLSMLALLVVRRCGRRRMHTTLERRMFLGVHALAGLLFMATEFYRLWKQEKAQAYAIMAGMSVCILLMLAYLADRLLLLEQAERMEADYKLHLNSMDKRLEAYEEGLGQIRRHLDDVRHHQLYLLSKLQEGMVESAVRYLQKWYGRLVHSVPTVITGNDVLDALLLHYQQECHEKNIRMSIQGRLPAKLAMQLEDLVSLVGNLMINAVRACEQVEPGARKIYILTRYSHVGVLSLKVSNSYRADAHMGKGLGLEIVREIAAKYGGDVAVDREKLFTVAVRLIL